MAKTTKNPFFETDFSKFMDVSKMMSDFKMPDMGFEAVMAAQRKNVEALAAANQLAFEGFQALARRQSEMVRETVQETSSLMNDAMGSGAPEDKMTRQADLAKQTLEKSLNNIKELSELLAKANYEAVEVLSNRMREGLEEMRGLVDEAQKAQTKE
ncbi:MAG: phasin family protein [Alphaproteobacteria bacterium]|nr:phasin family protein [Alphaproteobacteria bacterium]